MKLFLKTVYISFFLILVACEATYAETVVVRSLSEFSTVSPPKFIWVELMNNLVLDRDVILKTGDIVRGEITDVKTPQRLKRDATFSFVPVSYENVNGVKEISKIYVGRYTTKLNKAEMAKSAALTVSNHFVKGLSMGYRAVEGAVENNEGNRLKSSAIAIYENSPVSYVEKGEDVLIKKNQIFYLRFKTYTENK